MPKNNRRTGLKWFTCDYSGYEFRITEMVRQKGYRVARRFVDAPGGQSAHKDPRNRTIDPAERPKD